MHRTAILLALALMLTACSPLVSGSPKAVPVAVAPSLDLDLPDLGSASLLTVDDPLSALRKGEAAVALVHGPVPEGLEGFVFETRETVLMQGWLDSLHSFTLEEAEKLAQELPSPGTPERGALAAGRLSDLAPGWRAIPVEGILPTPESVQSGEYPLSGLISVAYAPDPPAEVVSVVETLRQAAEPQAEPWIRLTAAGDFMLARGVARAIRENGPAYPVAQVREHLASADIAFANLESPIGTKGTPLPGKQIWFQAAPEALEVLTLAGLDGLTLANNHIMDYDEPSLLETLDYLDGAGIGYTGAGRNLAEARTPLVLEAAGIKVAFLGYSQFADLFFDWNYPRSFAAAEELPGVAGIRDEWLAADIEAARQQADLVAVTFHWGEEFQNYPTAEQQRLARLCIDLGADLVLGYHPHAIQGFELYKDGIIAYSLGNFIMDNQNTDLARESMLLDLWISPAGVRQVLVHPVWIQAEQPSILTGPEAERLLAKMAEISDW